MIITDDNAIKKLVSNAVDISQQIQQCGIDLTVNNILKIDHHGSINFDNTNRKIPGNSVVPIHLGEKGEESFWYLTEGYYIVKYNEQISLKDNVMGQVFPRSSLMRMGATIQSAVWDPGYVGKGMGLLIVSTPIRVYKNARIAQMIFHYVQPTEKRYEGTFQLEGVKKKYAGHPTWKIGDIQVNRKNISLRQRIRLWRNKRKMRKHQWK